MKTEIADLILEITEEFQRLREYLESLENNVISDVLREHSNLRIKWEYYNSFIYAIKSEYEQKVEEKFSLAFIDLMDNQDRQLTPTEAKIYAQSAKGYVSAKKDLNSIISICKMTEGALRAIDDLKWNLKNQTDLVVRGAENYIL